MSTCPDHLPSTPDGRYFVHGGRLWRCSNPDLSDAEREARARVHTAKVALGERGPTWWGADADHNRYAPENTPYAEWWASLSDDERAAGS